MGLRGAGARSRKVAKRNPQPRPRALPWKKKGLSRAERVIAFLEFLPITKGILAGTQDEAAAGAAQIRAGDLRAVGKGRQAQDPHRHQERAARQWQDWPALPAWRYAICSDLNASRAAKFTPPLTTNCKPL